ncbi:MAG: DUF4381 domain-containing protein [Magnetococcales bacterium]|nr:DUF4381 domain-containing protein [Magnetococcales bacterium]
MNGGDPAWIDRLRPLHDPPPISWWPPAPGWWVVAALLLLMGVGAGRFVWRRRRRLRPRRQALRELAHLAERHARDHDDHALAAGVSLVLKRLALTLYARGEVASLSGEAWLRFLDATGPAGGTGFSEGPGRSLADAPYRSACRLEAQPLLELARGWVGQAGSPPRERRP